MNSCTPNCLPSHKSGSKVSATSRAKMRTTKRHRDVTTSRHVTLPSLHRVTCLSAQQTSPLRAPHSPPAGVNFNYLVLSNKLDQSFPTEVFAARKGSLNWSLGCHQIVNFLVNGSNSWLDFVIFRILFCL